MTSRFFLGCWKSITCQPSRALKWAFFSLASKLEIFMHTRRKLKSLDHYHQHGWKDKHHKNTQVIYEQKFTICKWWQVEKWMFFASVWDTKTLWCIISFSPFLPRSLSKDHGVHQIFLLLCPLAYIHLSPGSLADNPLVSFMLTKPHD